MKVLVYGSLKKGGWLHGYLEDSKQLEDREVEGFGMKSMGRFPAAYKKEGERILCEEYEIDADTLQNLDYAEGYPHFYNRTQVGESWLYYLEPEEVEDLSTINVIRTESGALSWNLGG